MKLTHKLCGAALLAAVGVAVAFPTSTNAEDTKKGPFSVGMDIEFEANTDDDTGLPTRETDITDLPVTDPGLFGVKAVTPLTFGQQKIQSSNAPGQYWAKNWQGTGSDGQPATTANFVEIKDERAVENHHYQLQAKITKQFEIERTVNGVVKSTPLASAFLTFNNGFYVNQTAVTALQLTKNTIKAPVVSEKAGIIIDHTIDGEEARGVGYTQIQFGHKNPTAEQADSEKSILLTVPAETQIYEGKYTGEITWELVAAP